MAGPRLLARSSLLCLFLIAAAGCASTPPPVKRSEPAKPKPASPPEEPPAPPQSPTEEISDKPKEVDVVDPGGAHGPVSLVEAAKAERERRARSGPPVAVINDKNVNQSKGQITIMAEPKKPRVTSETAAALQTLKDEQYWRSRALDIRTRLRQSTDRSKDLELSAAGWRRRFYAEEDPYFRDSKIKPEWDRVLAQLEETRNDVEITWKELEDFLEEGRRAGALPGWLREGGELEPAEAKPKTTPGIVDPEEPQIYEQKPPRERDAA